MKTTCEKAILAGNTRPIKDSLKKDGWQWDGRLWWKWITAAEADAICDATAPEAKKEAARAIGGAKKGCILTVRGLIRYTSPTYSAPTVGSTASHRRDQDGCGWNCDPAGNYVRSAGIPGSSPDDRV